jgi:putative methyltransferase (TIGR04325 family)
MESLLAPIVLFVYNRPLHTFQILEALAKNPLAKESILYIYSDGPKENATPDELIKIEETREVIRKHQWCKEVFLIEANSNKGLAHSIISGVTELINKYGKLIVLEDDTLPSVGFLSYINKGLDLYADDESVISIHGYNYPIDLEISSKTVFIKGADCWGWGTWKRGWDIFEKDGEKLLKQIIDRNLRNEFDFDNSFPYTQMLEDQVNGKNDSWAIRWYASAFLKNRYTLYPTKSLIKNIGLDSSGTHSGNDTFLNIKNINKDTFEHLHRINIEENKQVRVAFKHFFKEYLRKDLKEKDSIKDHYLFYKIYFLKKLKKYTPEFIKNIRKKALTHNCKSISPKYGWFGDYSNWDDAKKDSIGYQNNDIVEKVKFAILKVRNGEAEYERDSVNFDKIQYSWPILAALNWIAAQNQGNLNIIDFGGSLGSSYFQNRKFLKHLNKVEWNIVEQRNFVEFGKESLQNDELKFFNNVEECTSITSPETVLFSSVLQYIESPYSLIEKFFEKKIKYILIDLTGFTQNNESSKITVQKVDPVIYDASYPCWIFNKVEFVEFFLQHSYELIEDFVSDITINYMGRVSNYEGFIFRRQND